MTRWQGLKSDPLRVLQTCSGWLCERSYRVVLRPAALCDLRRLRGWLLFANPPFFTYAFNASFTRVCQPAPVARNLATTLRSTRKLATLWSELAVALVAPYSALPSTAGRKWTVRFFGEIRVIRSVALRIRDRNRISSSAQIDGPIPRF